MITRAREVGRLIEVRRIPPIDESDFDEVALASLGALLRSVERPVGVVDLREATLLPPKQADKLARIMARGKGTYERVAEILSPQVSPTLLLQLDRLAREQRDPSRRIFTDVREAIHWLDEVLTLEERARLRVFLRV